MKSLCCLSHFHFKLFCSQTSLNFLTTFSSSSESDFTWVQMLDMILNFQLSLSDRWIRHFSDTSTRLILTENLSIWFQFVLFKTTNNLLLDLTNSQPSSPHLWSRCKVTCQVCIVLEICEKPNISSKLTQHAEHQMVVTNLILYSSLPLPPSFLPLFPTL